LTKYAVDYRKQVPAPANKYKTAFQLATALKKELHYTVDLKNIVLTELGISRVRSGPWVSDTTTERWSLWPVRHDADHGQGTLGTQGY
jgi:hypothetical protein